MMSRETIGFIGLGIMGYPMACNLLRAGYGVVGHDISGKNGTVACTGSAFRHVRQGDSRAVRCRYHNAP